MLKRFIHYQLITLLLGVFSSIHAAAANPNIIIILADDMGYGDVQALNPESGIPTPGLNRLAQEGVVFTDAHTPSSICTPTRYGLLTGRYCWRTSLKSGVLKGYDSPLIEADRITIAGYLKDKGYQTGIVGKWHLGLGFKKKTTGDRNNSSGYDLKAPLDSSPNNNGFDYSFVLPASLDFEPYLYVRNHKVVDAEFVHVQTTEFPRFWREGIKSKSLEFDRVLDDLVLEAKAFIERSAQSEKPFFLYFPLTAPHKPIIPEHRFEGASGKGVYGDFVHQVDWTAGQLLKQLDKMDLTDNTLVIFTTDNGSAMYRRDSSTYPDHVTDETLDYYNEENHKANGPLRGIKGDAYEGGHRVPFIARWPERIPAGNTVDETVCLTDIYATLADITGGKIPAGNAEDSYSFARSLLDHDAGFKRPPVIHHSGGQGTFAIRKGSWKLILGNGSGARTKPVGDPFQRPYQLFNIKDDLAETTNLIQRYPEIAGQLESEFYEIKGSD